jgi:hypothetical protein
VAVDWLCYERLVAQSLLLIAWWNRRHFWGLGGAVMSQVYVDAMFFAIARDGAWSRGLSQQH